MIFIMIDLRAMQWGVHQKAASRLYTAGCVFMIMDGCQAGMLGPDASWVQAVH
jgi:hypothetical protein